MRTLQILPQKEGKGRVFSALCLATVEAKALWAGGYGDDMRPVWSMFAGSDTELRAFVANLQMGKKAVFLRDSRYSYRKSDKLELLKSAGYVYTWQREAEGSVVTVFLPDLFRLDPGMVDPKGASFIVLPSVEWSKVQKLEDREILQHALKLNYSLPATKVQSLIPMAFLFAAYLDRRTRAPLLSDGRFYVQLFLSCLSAGLATFTTDQHSSYRDPKFGVHSRIGFTETDTLDVGLLPGVAFDATHEEIEKLLADEVAQFFSLTRGAALWLA